MLIAALIPRDLTLALVVYAISAAVSTVFVLWNSGYSQGRHGAEPRQAGARACGSWPRRPGKPVGFGAPSGARSPTCSTRSRSLLGYAWPLWDEQRQTFADKVCCTLVVQADL